MLIVVPGVRQKLGTVELVDQGTFFCLHCKADRGYQLRAWQQTTRWFYLQVGKTRGEFVRCDACGSAFDRECLDESSTASLESLRELPPRFALGDRMPAAAASAGRLGNAQSLQDYLDT